jgi:ADP-ribose pyrophosphatase YjhB (NUDIX family)
MIRPIALAVIWNGDRLLVCEGHDPIKGETFYRPLGGGIEFGERAEDTVRRELLEEIEAEVINVESIGTLENLFTYNGVAGHEIVLLFAADLADPGLYQLEVISGTEDNGQPLKVLWKPMPAFETGAERLYPDGLTRLLSSRRGRPAGPGS